MHLEEIKRETADDSRSEDMIATWSTGELSGQLMRAHA